jgi:hypothetical protein
MSPRFQFWSSAILGMGFIGYLASELWGVPLTISIPISALLVGAPALVLWKWSSRRKQHFAGMHKTVSHIRNLSLPEAKSRALAALEDPTRFECRREPLARALPANLPSAVRDLLSIYASVKTVAGEAIVARERLGPARFRSGFMRIGTDQGDVELVVRPGEEPIYEIDGSEADAREIEQREVPSIYHWVLITEEVLYGKE